ncbi:MAG: SCO family protein [Burkholderiales bacterium]
MLRTALASLSLALLGWWSAAWITEDFQVWTAEGARRLTVIEQPVRAPKVALLGPGLIDADLQTFLTGAGRATIVDFVYTRCPTVCTTLGIGFQQLQQALGAQRTEGVKLLSISFDPAHDDAAGLQRYATQWRADPSRWAIATVPDADQLQRLLKVFQVVVIDDGRGGYEHNAALLVLDGRGRLVRIFDDTELELALNYARSIARRGAGE